MTCRSVEFILRVCELQKGRDRLRSYLDSTKPWNGHKFSPRTFINEQKSEHSFGETLVILFGLNIPRHVRQLQSVLQAHIERSLPRPSRQCAVRLHEIGLVWSSAVHSEQDRPRCEYFGRPKNRRSAPRASPTHPSGKINERVRLFRIRVFPVI